MVKIKEFLENLKLENNTSVRTDCPFCSHSNSFSVSKINSLIVYNCFFDRCKKSGASGIERKGLSSNQHTIIKEEYKTPERFLNGYQFQFVREYLDQYNIRSLFDSTGMKIYYDPMEMRIVFPIMLNGLEVSAAGRALYAGIKPKWRMYGPKCIPYLGFNYNVSYVNHTKCIVVEDCLSVLCLNSIGQYAIGLCGTSPSEWCVDFINRSFTNAFVALDADAVKTSLTFLQKLWYGKIIVLKKDIKDMNMEELKEFLSGSIFTKKYIEEGDFQQVQSTSDK